MKIYLQIIHLEIMCNPSTTLFLTNATHPSGLYNDRWKSLFSLALFFLIPKDRVINWLFFLNERVSKFMFCLCNCIILQRRNHNLAYRFHGSNHAFLKKDCNWWNKIQANHEKNHVRIKGTTFNLYSLFFFMENSIWKNIQCLPN